jgi:hypothetical protein
MAATVAQAAFCLACSDATLAQEQDRGTIDARRCLELQSPDERLACFEKQVDEPSSRAPTPAAGAGVSAPSPPQSTAPTVVDVADLPREDAGRGVAPSQSELVGYIASLRERAPNQYLITLDNGQVWLQRLAERYHLRVGQRVRIYHSRFGLRLQADGVNGFIQVERVRD